MAETDYTKLSDWHIIWLVREREKALKEYNRRIAEDKTFTEVINEYNEYHKEMKNNE